MRVRLVLVACLIAPAVALTSGLASAADWTGPPLTLTESAESIGTPASAAIAATSKDAFVAWNNNASAVRLATRPAGGSFTVQTFAASSPGPPAVASAPSGHAFAVWRSGSVVQGAERAPGGTFAALGDLASSAVIGQPLVAVIPDGTVLLVLARSTGVYARIRPPGGVFGFETPLYTFAAGEGLAGLYLTVNATGGALVTHVTAVPAATYTTVARANIFAAGAGFGAVHEIATASITGGVGASRQFDAVAGVLADNGDAVVVMRDGINQSPSQTTAIVASYRQRDASAWSALQTLDSQAFTGTAGTIVRSPAATFTSTGEVLAAWAREGAGPPGTSAIRASAAASVASAFAASAEVAAGPGATASSVRTPLLFPIAGGLAKLVHARGVEVASAVRPPAGVFGPSADLPGPAQHQSGLAIAATPAGDALATWTYLDSAASKYRARAVIHDASPPLITAASVPATGAPAETLAMSASASDAFSSVPSFAWAFGDDGLTAGATVTHAYARPGAYTTTLTATDAAGNAASTSRPVTIAATAAPPATPPTSPGALTVPRPTVRSFSVRPKRFAVGTKPTALSAAARAPRGTRLRYDVSAAGTVRVTIARLLPGRRSGTRCVKPTRRLRTRKRCTRAVTKGTLTRKVIAGTGTIAFSGRLGRKALVPGRYRATVIATTPGAPARSAPRTATFTIVRR